MKEKHEGKFKIIITFAVLFVVVAVLLLLVFFAGKKTHIVRFDLDGGILIGGSLEQHVTQGQDATPPTAVKDGAYLRGWSASYKQITKDVVIRAIWEYETTPGISYSSGSNQNFVEIAGAYKYIRGEIYLGAYYGDKKVLGIREEAFSECVGITKVYLLDGLLYIGNNAFSGCTSLAEIEIPETVTHMGVGVFLNCEALETLVLNNGLLEIGDNAFEGCTSLTEIVIPDTVTHIGAGAFKNCAALKQITIPESVTYIGEGAFEGCESLETVVFNNELTEIADNAFSGCTSLTEIVIPETVTLIGASAFKGCESLETLVLNEGIVKIGMYAFRGCVGLKEITLPESLETMGYGVFSDCEELVISITHVEDKNYDGWRGGWCGDAEVILPEGLTREDLNLDRTNLEVFPGIVQRPGQIWPEGTIKPGFDIEINPDDSTESEDTETPEIDTEKLPAGQIKPGTGKESFIEGLTRPKLELETDESGEPTDE